MNHKMKYCKHQVKIRKFITLPVPLPTLEKSYYNMAWTDYKYSELSCEDKKNCDHKQITKGIKCIDVGCEEI